MIVNNRRDLLNRTETDNKEEEIELREKLDSHNNFTSSSINR